jgi:hypothetical protein
MADNILERIDKFHHHLDICAQCRNHPFDLCPEGAGLLKYAATGKPLTLQETRDRIAAMNDNEVIGAIIREVQRLQGIEFENDPRPEIPGD